MSAFPSNTGSQVGLEIWRIEKLSAVHVDPKTYGTFYNADAYIVLNTYHKGAETKRDLHFWLGEKSTNDEQGAAAILTVKLDDQLTSHAPQHREVQGYESPLFASYFPSGLVYATGGVGSAFHHVGESSYSPRLFEACGKRNIRLYQVPLSAESLNDGAVFILDAGRKIYQWNGKNSNKFEKVKGLEVAQRIKDDERDGKAEVIHLEQTHDEAASADFYKLLGGKPASIKPAPKEEEDAVLKVPLTLHRVSAGKVVEKVADSKLKRELLDHKAAYLLDANTTIFIWVGKQSSADEHKTALSAASAYLSAAGRPPHTQISRLADGGETPAFKALFLQWEPIKFKTASSGHEYKEAELKSNTAALYQARQKAAEEKIAAADGSVAVWRIENFKKQEIKHDEYGQFYAGDSYVVLYTYKQQNKELHTIFFWQGRDSTTDEKGASAFYTADLGKSFSGEPAQVRIVQGKEPNTFLALFRGKFIVHRGGVASGFHNHKDVSSGGAADNRLYLVKGTTPLNVHAVQVDAVASNLNSHDTFILLSKDSAFTWVGKGSNDAEKAATASFAAILKGSRAIVALNEGAESDAFWSALGGKAAYPQSKELLQTEFEPRLFEASLRGHSFTVEEVVNFTQDDLIQEDVFLLDAGSEVLVWVGNHAPKNEKDLALQAALDYVKNAPTHSHDSPVFKIVAGQEPPNFTCHFPGWDAHSAEVFVDPYLKRLGKLPAGEAAKVKEAEEKNELVTAVQLGFDDPQKVKHSIEQLKQHDPKGVDPTKKEQYLSDDEFKKTFAVGPQEFKALPKWKQVNLKKKFGLF